MKFIIIIKKLVIDYFKINFTYLHTLQMNQNDDIIFNIIIKNLNLVITDVISSHLLLEDITL